MSEAIKVKEGGTDKTVNQINKLKTNLSGGGVCYWVPETERETDDKSITKNGSYTAEDEGLYGYSEINVNVYATGGISGKDNPGGGEVWNDYNIAVDDYGYFVETEVPSYIMITTEPTKKEYYEGDEIDIAGMVVKAYTNDGELWVDSEHPDGIIGLDELIITPSTAPQWTPSEGGEAPYTDVSGLEYPTWNNPLKLCPSEFNGRDYRKNYHDTQKEYRITYREDAVYAVCILCKQTGGTSDSTYSKHCVTWISKKPFTINNSEARKASGLYVYDALARVCSTGTLEYTRYSQIYIDGNIYENVSSSGSYSQNANMSWYLSDILKIMQNAFDNETIVDDGVITVTWYRAVDNVPLTATFNISIEPVESGTAHNNTGGNGNYNDDPYIPE